MTEPRERSVGTAGEFLVGLLAALAACATVTLGALAVWRVGTEPERVTGTFVASAVLLVFTGTFGALWFVLRAGRQTAERIAERRACHPDEPWRWTEEKWQQGRIRSVSETVMAVALVAFAAVWNAALVGGASVASRRPDMEPTAQLLLAVVFGLPGVALIAAAAYQVTLARRFGRSLFVMDAVPGVLGGPISGTVQLPPQVPPGADVRAALRCDWINTTRSGSSSGGANRRSRVWEDERRSHVLPDGTLQVAFTIPFDLPPSDDESPSGASLIEWRLALSAAIPGIDYSAAFEVPVFATAASDRSIRAGASDPLSCPGRPADAKTSVVESAGSRTVLAMPPAKGLVTGVSGFFLIPGLASVIGHLAGLGPDSAHMVTQGALLAGSTLLILCLVGILVTATRIEIDPHLLRVPHGRWPLCWTRRVPTSDVAEFTSSSTGNTASSRVDVRTSGGKNYWISGQLSGVEEAKWLAAELTRALGRARA